MSLVSKIEQLRDIYKEEGDQETINEWHRIVVEGISIKSLEEKEGVILILMKLRERKGVIDEALLNKREMTENERATAFLMRDNIEELIGMFKSIDLSIIEQQINEKL